MATREIRRCTRCVIDDSSDVTISFDSHGHCSYCRQALTPRPTMYFPNATGQKHLEAPVNALKAVGRHKDFNCAIGLSGGLDSSYLAYLTTPQWGLRVLALHVDDSFTTPVTVSNVTELARRCNLEVVHLKPNSAQFNDLTRAHLLAGVPNVAPPQDNILFAALRPKIRSLDIKVFHTGGNFALECIPQRGNGYSALDTYNIQRVGSIYGRRNYPDLPFLSQARKRRDFLTKSLPIPRPFNCIKYNRARAISTPHTFSEFEYCGAKHLENTLTKFVQVYGLYEKFGVDKRTSHLLSMIVSDQISSDEELELLEVPPYDPVEIHPDIDLISERMELPKEQLVALASLPGVQQDRYGTSRYLQLDSSFIQLVRKLTNIDWDIFDSANISSITRRGW